MKKRYDNPPILDGYKHVAGRWNNGFVIQRITDGSQFVWVPVGSLNADGTLDGKRFTEQFGRRNYRRDRFSDTEYHEPLTAELLEQKESVEKYGGFYISCYNISKSSDGNAQSVADAAPWVNINFEDAQSEAAKFERGEAVKSHLTYGAEYDSVLAWLIKSGAVTLQDILKAPKVFEKKGTNNIYNFVSDVTVDQWTQEKNARFCRTIRGCANCNSSVVVRDYFYPGSSFDNTGFRIVLCIK